MLSIMERCHLLVKKSRMQSVYLPDYLDDDCPSGKDSYEVSWRLLGLLTSIPKYFVTQFFAVNFQGTGS